MRRSYFAPAYFCYHRPALTVQVRLASLSRKMVEAPGTAPGSALLIPRYVYRHSQPELTNTNIEANQ